MTFEQRIHFCINGLSRATNGERMKQYLWRRKSRRVRELILENKLDCVENKIKYNHFYAGGRVRKRTALACVRVCTRA
jgi:hypothetical protein